MKRFLGRLLGGVLAVLIVYGVQAIFTNVVMPGKIDDLAGTYVTQDYMDAESVEELLTDYEFYTEEIALIDLNTLYAPYYVEFDTDKNYTFYYDADGFRANVEAFLRQAFESMYAGREGLSEVYGEDFSVMSLAEFQNYYATLYSAESFDALMTTLADSAYDYDYVAQDKEVGTYTIEDDKILCTIAGHTNAEAMGYKLSGDTLTLTFTNMVQTYTRVK